MKRRGGFSLIATMVSVVIAGIVITVLFKGLLSSDQFRKSVALGGDFEDLKNIVRMNLNVEDSCRKMMVSSAPNPQLVPAAIAGTAAVVLYGVLQPGQTGGLTIGNIAMKRVADFPDVTIAGTVYGTSEATIDFSATKTKESAGVKTLTASLPFIVVWNKGTRAVFTCYGSETAAGMCSDLGGVYDPNATPKCKIVGGPVSPMADLKKQLGYDNFPDLINCKLLTNEHAIFNLQAMDFGGTNKTALYYFTGTSRNQPMYVEYYKGDVTPSMRGTRAGMKGTATCPTALTLDGRLLE